MIATHHSIGHIFDATFTKYSASKAVLFEPFLRMVSELHKAKTSKFHSKRTNYQVRNAIFHVGVEVS